MIEIDVAIGDQTVYEATLKNGSKHCFRCPGQNNDHGQKNELIAIWTDRNDQIVRFTELEEIESLTARPDIAVSPDALRHAPGTDTFRPTGKSSIPAHTNRSRP